jgi:hypothetical protein
MKVLPYLNPYKSIIYLEFFEQGKVYFKPWQIWINLKILNKSEKYCSLRAEPKASRPITTMKLDHLYFLLPHAARPGAAVPGSCRHPLLHAPVPPPSPPPRGRNTKPHPPSPPHPPLLFLLPQSAIAPCETTDTSFQLSLAGANRPP